MSKDKIVQIKAAATPLLAIAILVSVGWLLFQAFSTLSELRSDMGRMQDDLDQLQTDVGHLQTPFSAI